MQDGLGRTLVEHRHRLQGGQRHLVRGRVAESDVVELDRGRAGRQVDRAWPVGDRRWQVEHLENPLEGNQGGHHVDVDVRQLGQRAVEARQIGGQRDDGTDLQGPLGGEPPAHAVDDRGRQGGDQGQRDEEDPAVHGLSDSDVADPGGLGREAVVLP